MDEKKPKKVVRKRVKKTKPKNPDAPVTKAASSRIAQLAKPKLRGGPIIPNAKDMKELLSPKKKPKTTEKEIKARKKQSEKDLGFLRIGSLNVRVKKTTEAFSNFLGVGSGSTSSNTQASHRHHHSRHHAATTTRMNRNRLPAHLRTSAPPKGNQFDKLHKSWGSADNIPHDQGTMPPPTNSSIKKTRSKQSTDNDSAGYSSMPTTPNQLRAPIGILSENPKAESVMDSDSDSACGFGSNWSVTRSGGSDSIGKKAPTYL